MIGFNAEDLSKVLRILNFDHDFVSTRPVLLCILDFEDDFVFRRPVVLSISVLVLHIEQLQRITPGVFKA